MRSGKEIHEEYLSNLEMLKSLESQNILFSDKKAYERMLLLVIERNNVLNWVMGN